MARTPLSPGSIARTRNVEGRRSASRTIHISRLLQRQERQTYSSIGPIGVPLSPQQIGFEPSIATFLCPQRQRNRREIVHDRNGTTVGSEVDRAQIGFTGVASIDSNMRQLVGHVDRQLLFVLLTATRTEDPSKLPLGEAKRADQAALAPVAPGPQHAQKWRRLAARTIGGPPIDRRGRHAFGEKLHIRLQKSAQNEILLRLGALVLNFFR